MELTAHDRIVEEIAAIAGLPRSQQSQEWARLLPPMPEGVRTASISASGFKAEWVRTPSSLTDRFLLYLHGGGYTEGSPASHRSLVARVAAATCATALTVDYRLAPENPFPAALDDSLAAFRWLRASHPAAKIGVVGDSAGGGLAVSMLTALRDSGERTATAAGLMSPWCDLDLTGDSVSAADDPLVPVDRLRKSALAYAGSAGVRHPLVSPLFGALHGLPPLFIQVGEREILRDDSRRLAARARAAGVEAQISIWPGMTHVWQFWGNAVPQADRAIRQLGSWLVSKMGVK